MRKLLTLSLAALCVTAILAPAAHALRNLSLRQMGELPRDQFVDLVDPDFYRTDKMIVQFSEDTRVRLQGDRLVSLEGRSLAGVEAFLKAHPGIEVSRVFQSMSVEELDAYVERGERLSGIDVADLNNFYLFTVKGGNRDAQGLLLDLLKHDIVQTAYYEAIPSPAECGNDPGPTTPSYVASQDYREAAPTGVDINYAWSFDPTYGNGLAGYWFQHLEWGWTQTHEDFSSLSILSGPDSVNPDHFNHGTAVMSVVGACDDGKGVTGLTPNVTLTARVVTGHFTTADALIALGNSLITGETYLIAMQAQGPNPGWACVCNCTQFRHIAMEYWTAEFNAILANSTNGITCIEAAGNGSMDLDWAGYGDAFNLGFRDSGAIVVGAGTSGSVHNPQCWTNHGTRISAQGWGDGICAAGYGDLFNPAGVEQDYTASFSGTSGASPIVAGTAISLALIHRYQHGTYMSPWDLRSRLAINGTPQGPVDTWKEINVQPNMKGILAPDVAPYNPGWADAIVPSNVTGTSTLPTDLSPAPAPTYFDWAWANWSHYSTIGAYQNDIRVDDVPMGTNYMASHPAYWYYNTIDYNIPVRGGLHYVQLLTDVNGGVDEGVETNNNQVNAYRWDATYLASDAPQFFTRGPNPYPTGAASPAVDGYGNNGSHSYWDIFGVIGETTADYDIALYADEPSTNSGWTSPVASSAYGSLVDFVGSNHNTPNTANYASVLNYDNSSEGYVVEREGSIYYGHVPSVQTLLTSNQIVADEILDVIEVYVPTLTPVRFALDVTNGDADLALFVFGPTATQFARASALFGANATGPGGDEVLTFMPMSTGYHSLVICKNSHTDRANSASYDVYVGPPAGDLTHHTPAGWTAPVVARDSGVGTVGELPATLNEGAAVLDVGVANIGSGDTTYGPINDLTVDGIVVASAGPYGSLWPGYAGWLSEWPVGTVKGGRHEVGSLQDATLAYAEELPDGESNNSFFTQYAWAPLGLVHDVPLSRSAAPNWANFNNPDYWLLPGLNQDGYTFGTTYWGAFAAMPTDPMESLSTHVYDNTDNNSTTALLGPVASAYGAPGEISFTVLNGNVLGYGATRNFGVNNSIALPYAWPSAPYTVQAAVNQGDMYPGSVHAGSLAGGAEGGQILHIRDLYLEVGQAYPVTLFNNSSVDLGLALFHAGTFYQSSHSADAIFNATGPGENESGLFYAPFTGWHGLAVYRTRSTDLGPTADYRVAVGAWAPAPVNDLDITMTDTDGTDNVVGFFLDWSDVTTDTNGNPVAVDHYNCYYSATSVPGWNHFHSTVTSSCGPFGATIAGNPVFTFMVTAVDENGMVLATSAPFQGPLVQDGTPTSRVLGFPADVQRAAPAPVESGR